MEIIYSIMEKLLPFSWIQYDFMKNAFIAILIITPLFGMIGTMIVNNNMAFFSDALGHSALTGIAIGVILGVKDTDISMIIFAIVFALLLNFIKERKAASTDTVISVFSSMSTAIGLVILSMGGDFSKYSGLLVGDVLSITPREILMLVIIFIITVCFWLVCFNKLMAISMNESLAASRHIKVSLINNLFAVVIALIVMLSIKWVGVLIINALLILPAAAARNISENIREYTWFSIVISMFSGIVGLVLSYSLDTATGPTIVIISAVIFFMTLLSKRFVKG